jgi:hypothetical protein
MSNNRVLLSIRWVLILVPNMDPGFPTWLHARGAKTGNRLECYKLHLAWADARGAGAWVEDDYLGASSSQAQFFSFWEAPLGVTYFFFHDNSQIPVKCYSLRSWLIDAIDSTAHVPDALIKMEQREYQCFDLAKFLL